ncbi:gtp-binding protein [Plasmopara halstedii]|uniref:Gtp-binding protein n=1 Tax=Plasmopara halstedii TaxID=4781 RepID=A0A0P1AZH3_PLAHL|nr:gtp-binding protein [Plasmopara halstedii]CEG46853.1 gtp-binding protein [Plasmopara halstedii]|eukprot:XP_024583222.1 gtp-binding protein [Plasmopara halstedii]
MLVLRRQLASVSHRFRTFASVTKELNDGEALTPKTIGSYMSKRLEEFEPERIRNFSIVAHIDHGKSTLADRLLETSGNISRQEREKAQFLDNLKVERERGITVKAQTASMLHRDSITGMTYMLNLVDTPGHVDFSYEVNRSLSACEGVLLLVDCSQGIQAQTLATYYAAKERNLHVVPVLTKIDMPHAEVDDSILSLSSLLNVDPDDVLLTSAKTGDGINEVLPAVVSRLPPPVKCNRSAPLRCLLVDSFYDDYRGTVCLVKVVDGALFTGDRIYSAHQKTKHEVQETGLLLPSRFKTEGLYAGQVGYIIAGMKSTTEAKVGDTFFKEGALSADMKALPGFQEARSMVFASMYPTDDSSFDELRVAIEKLTLNDASVTTQQETSGALGNTSDGYSANGPVHCDRTEGTDGRSINNYSVFLSGFYERVIVTIDVPWQEIVTNFYNELKTISSGYATLNYREITPQRSDIVKVDVMINGKVLDALSFVCHRSRATPDGRLLCQKLKRVIDRQQFEISIQAALGGKIFAKERIAPYRKDVLIKSGKTVGGGDSTRKKKLLAKQKEGKRRMRTVSNVQLSQDAFWSVLSN